MTPTLIIITLVLVGILMMLIEFLLTPGLGIAGIVGLASFVGSCVYAFVECGTRTGSIVTAVVALIVIIMVIWMLRSNTWKKLQLKTEIDTHANTQAETLAVGDTGKTVTRLAPMGTARIGKTTCEAKSFDNSMIDPGTEVEVVEIEDSKVIVKPVAK